MTCLSWCCFFSSTRKRRRVRVLSLPSRVRTSGTLDVDGSVHSQCCPLAETCLCTLFRGGYDLKLKKGHTDKHLLTNRKDLPWHWWTNRTVRLSRSLSLSLTLALFHRWNKRTTELLLLHNIVKEIIIVAPCSTLPAWHTFCLFFPLLLWFQSFFLLRCDDVFFPSLLLEVSLVWFHFSVRSDRHMYVRSSYAQTNKMVYSQETRIPDCV